ncbi:MAG: aminopeptidase P family protein [Bacteroidales bacterium]|nr:aminopeptidase P family protein [Bacteroidales bacterium]MDD4673678.1 aminopeptidase P family protein [Bacteroidales bacterium]MDY0349484.1 aminopeptidase P family protein [Tenuifilaceae bacterium]
MKIANKLKSIRESLKAKNILAYIIPSSDPHLSEYLPDCWKFRAWASGFTGSAGTFVVGKNKAALWTDSRYFLQAEKELEGSTIELCRMGLPSAPSIEEWLAETLNTNDTVGFNGKLFAHSAAKSLTANLSEKGLKVASDIDIIPDVWENRPSAPNGKAFEHELRYAGLSVLEKIEEIRENLSKQNADACIISALDDVAWTFNIRGNDVDYNPVVLSFGYISKDEAILFIDLDKMDDSLTTNLEEQGVEILNYNDSDKFVSELPGNLTVSIDETKLNHTLANLIPKEVKTIDKLSIPTKLKAIKNAVELENIKQSLILDGIAMCNFLHWLETSVKKEEITELTIAEKLVEYRSQQDGFVSESFETIAGYKEHGAIVHYSATPETASAIKPNGFLLIDSGAQYLQGTTDITRTLHLGTPTNEEKKDYTLVLKGMIQLSKIQFPVGTRGSQLDTLARMDMWNEGINFGHGTGHGIGAFLNVHEGPQSIRPNENPVTIEPGMVQSNEPGIYRAGKHGIRIENLIACKKTIENEFGAFLGFDTITLCPIDTKPIRVEMLQPDEREWLNSYHGEVYEKLAPMLEPEVKAWLKDKTRAI